MKPVFSTDLQFFYFRIKALFHLLCIIDFFSNEEAGRYLETYKCYENKPADILQERVDGDHNSKVIVSYF